MKLSRIAIQFILMLTITGLLPFLWEGKALAIELLDSSSLLETLKKKKVLSRKDVKKIKRSYPRLEINGLFQLQYEKSEGETASDETDELFVRRLQISFVSRINSKVSLIMEPEYGKGEPPLKDAYLEYRGSANKIRIGNHLVPFSPESLVDDKNMMFVERSLTSQLAPEHNMGVSLSRKMRKNKLILRGGVWSSDFNADAESNLIGDKLEDNRILTTDFNERGNNLLIGAARIDYSTAGHDRSKGHSYKKKGKNNFALGVSYYSTISSPSEDGPLQGVTGLKSSSAYEVDILLSRKRFALDLEYAVRTMDWWQYSFSKYETATVTSLQTSYSAQAYIHISRKWSLTGRYEFFEYDSENNILRGKDGQESDTWITSGINYEVKKYNSRVQVNYITKDEGMPSGNKPVKNNTTLIQSTIYF